MNEEVRHFSLRKLSVGLASVLVGVSIFGASQTVKADTVADQTASAVTGSMQNSDTQENGNAAESTFSNVNRVDNAKSNATQTQENEPKQVQAENAQHDSAPETQEVNNKDLGAEKGIVHTSPLQEPDNQSNTGADKSTQHNTLESGQKTQSFNLPKNSQKLNRTMLATNLIATSPMTNGGFDEATWGKLDVNDWQGSAQDGFYQLTKYTGDKSHIIVPNEADFEKAGKSTNGLQVGITRDTIHSLSSFSKSGQTIAFSKTSNQKVKAIDDDWAYTFATRRVYLSKFDGSGLDVSNVTDMSGMFNGTSFGFFNDKISDLTSLANWDTSKVTDMSYMFTDNKISDLTPLTNWNTSNVTNMRNMFQRNSISDLTPLANWDTSNVTNMSDMFGLNKISDLTLLTNWKTSNVTDMSYMFTDNKISDLTPLVANWDVSKVTDMSNMFAQNPNLKDVKPITNWNMSSIADWGLDDLFEGDAQLDLTDTDMRSFLKKPSMLQGSTFLTNDADFVKANTGKTLSTLTNTATRTILFNFPDGTSKTITQTIYYKTKAIAPAQIYWPSPDGGRVTLALMALNPPLLAKNTPVQADPDGLTPVDPDDPNSVNHYNLKPIRIYTDPDDPNSGNHYNLKLIRIYTAKDLKASDWQLDDAHSKDNLANSITVNGQVYFKPVPIPHFKGYKASIVKNPINPMKLMVSFMAVPTENKPSTPVEVTPSKPSAPVNNPSKPSAPADNTNKPVDDLQHRVITELNSSDSGWTMQNTQPATYTVEVPADNTIDLSDLVIAEPVHAQTRIQIHVNKRFKLSKKNIAKYLVHRKNATRTFKKYRL